MSRVSPKVLALLAALTLVWGTNWPLFRVALAELPVFTFRTIVLVSAIATLGVPGVTPDSSWDTLKFHGKFKRLDGR